MYVCVCVCVCVCCVCSVMIDASVCVCRMYTGDVQCLTSLCFVSDSKLSPSSSVSHSHTHTHTHTHTHHTTHYTQHHITHHNTQHTIHNTHNTHNTHHTTRHASISIRVFGSPEMGQIWLNLTGENMRDRVHITVDIFNTQHTP